MVHIFSLNRFRGFYVGEFFDGMVSWFPKKNMMVFLI